MPKSRREKTLADYVVIAISPALVMTLVGSLVFFLLELSYRGDFELRVRWIMFWFVVGAVLVARIAIQEGRDRGNVFGGALVLVVGLAVVRFVDAMNVIIICWVLLAIIWWCSWKLTWDCTLIDDDEDASGEGLLEAAGLVGGQNPETAAQAAGGKPAVAAEFDAAGVPGSTIDEGTSSRSRPHAPGRWVVYFSLAALPLFGVGQLFIPAANTAGRAFGFQLLAIYVASALGLLLTTSFLGLRRYLRQRKLQMPMAVTGTWLAMGTGLAVALLLLAVFIPRPQGGEYTLTALVDKIDAKAREASRLAVLRGDKAEGEGRRIGEQDQKANKPGGAQQPQQQQPANAQQGEQAQGDGKQDGQQGQAQGDGKQQGGQQGQAQGDGKKQDAAREQDGKKAEANPGNQAGQQQQQQQGQQQQKAEQAAGNPDKQGQRGGQPQNQNKPDGKPAPQNPGAGTDLNKIGSPGSPGLLATLAPFVKWIIYGLMAAVVLFVIVRYWSRVVEILKQLWAELLSLFGFKKEPAAGDAGEEESPAPVRLLPFAAYDDPFMSGAARRMAPAQLIRYTFEALEAWAREQVIARPADQTPLEFAQELGRRVPALAKDVTETAQLYVQIAYAGKSPSKDAIEILERMWRRMQVTART
jgi:hypothetical protein